MSEVNLATHSSLAVAAVNAKYGDSLGNPFLKWWKIQTAPNLTFQFCSKLYREDSNAEPEDTLWVVGVIPGNVFEGFDMWHDRDGIQKPLHRLYPEIVVTGATVPYISSTEIEKWSKSWDVESIAAMVALQEPSFLNTNIEAEETYETADNVARAFADVLGTQIMVPRKTVHSDDIRVFALQNNNPIALKLNFAPIAELEAELEGILNG